MRKVAGIIVFLVVFIATSVFSQSAFPDSLYNELRLAKTDTDRVLIHAAIAEYYGWNAADSMVSHAISVKTMSQKIGYTKGIFLGHSLIARACYITGDYARGLTDAIEALRIAREEGVLEWEKQALSRVALLHLQTEKYAEALEHFTTLFLLIDSAAQPGVYATALNNIGNCYHHLDSIPQAIHYRHRAIAIRKKMDSPSAIGDSYNDLGETYMKTGRYDSALFYLKPALILERKGGDEEMCTVASMNIGNVFIQLGQFDSALVYFHDAYSNAERIGANDYRLAILNHLADIAGKQGKYELQAELLTHVLSLSDTLHNEASQAQINRLHAEFDTENKELMIKSLETEKEQQALLVAEKEKRSNMIIVFSVCGIIFLVVFLVVINNRFRLTKKQKATIEHQKAIVDQKQKEVLDSINYAKRIQYTLLAHDALLTHNLPEHFIFFQPKDIVSGDFYWATKTVGSRQSGTTIDNAQAADDCFYLAVCDSTGHGVPGAFMSLLNISFLNEAINEKNISSPEAILNHVRQRLIASVSQDGAQDGMDGVLLRFDRSSNKISYAAAHNAPLIIRNKEIMELSADKMPIGAGQNTGSFNLHQPEVKSGDMLYLFTDGYADQFGGPKGKKFMYRRLRNLLQEIAALPIEMQKNKLAQEFAAWKGDHEQVDDVCLLGIRI